MLNEFPITNIIAKQEQERVCTVPDCKRKPSFGPILMPNNDFTLKETYLCVECKELFVRKLIEKVMNKDIEFEVLNN
jgi:hypothetical protein